MHFLATTAFLVAMARAQEHARPDRLFEDPYASLLAGPEGAESWSQWEQSLSQWDQELPAPTEKYTPISIRTRFFDDLIKSLVQRESVEQVMLLGAGMDTRAFRLQLPPKITVFELDYPELLAIKDDRLQQVRASPSCRRVTVGTDLNTDWTSDLLRCPDFEPKRATAWLMEGLLLWLDERDVHGLMNRLSALTNGRAWLLADILGRTFLNFPSIRRMMEIQTANGGIPIRFGTDDPKALLGGYGWNTTVTELGDEGANLRRWTQLVSPPQGYQYPHVYLVVAKRKLAPETQ